MPASTLTSAPGGRARLAVLDQHQRLRNCGGFVDDQRVGFTARGERAVGPVRAVGEHLAHCRKAEPRGRSDHGAAGERVQHHAAAQVLHRARNRVGELGILRSHVVERAVRLHVMQSHALGAGERFERTGLIEHEVVALLRGNLHRPAPESLQIGQRHMRADRNAVADSERNGAAQRRWVAGVEPARDVRRGHERHQCAIVAHGPSAVALAHVAVEVNRPHRRTPREFAAPPDRPAC